MKHFPFGVMITLFFTAMLFFPKAVFNGASEGLLLWFQIVFPTLFPFLVITNLLLETGGIRLISRIFGGFFRRVFRVSDSGAFAVLSGFLCGYPMGAKITADLLRAGYISKKEGSYLLSFCNNTSPVFILNFIVWKTFGDDRLMLPTLFILMMTPVLLSFVFRRFYLPPGTYFQSARSAQGAKKQSLLTEERGLRRSEQRQPGQKAAFRFSTLDSCMMNSFEAIVKVGGYIILFSVILSLLGELPVQTPLLTVLSGTLEVTNGILILKHTLVDFELCYPAVIALTSFGGFCSIAQTECMLDGTGLKILPYMIQKLAASLAASLLAILYLSL